MQEHDPQTELFDSADSVEVEAPVAKPSRRKAITGPAKHFAKAKDQMTSLAFGWQNEFNLLGHVVDIFDQIPLYNWDRRVPAKDGVAQPITIPGSITQGKEKYTYNVTITPNARFLEHTEITRSGKTRTRLEPLDHNIQDHTNIVVLRPGHREDSVEKAIRRLARRLNGSTPTAPVYRAAFTLYQLKSELDRSGHKMKWDELRESLHILSNTGITLTVETQDGRKINYKTSFISSLLMGSRNPNAKHYNPDSDRCYCTLNDVVAYCLQSERYQAFQHEIYLKLNTFLARRILAALSIEWRNAHAETGYERSMNELIMRGNCVLSERLNDDYRIMKKALDELQLHGVLSKYEMEKVVTGTGRAGRDYRIFLYPTSAFVTTQIEAIKDRTIRTERFSLRRPTLQKSEV